MNTTRFTSNLSLHPARAQTPLANLAGFMQPGEWRQLTNEWMMFQMQVRTGLEKYGKTWLLPYETGKDPTDSYPTAHTWHDDLIISTRPISMGGTSDTSPPSVSVTAPANGSTVSSTISAAANAADNVGVAGVQFNPDGASPGAEDTASPYSVSWNTTTASNGSHTLTAVARDGAGNATTSAAITVTMANNHPPVANAGPDQTVTLLGGATLRGSATDDGLPSGALGVQLSMVSGPAPPVFSSPTDATTNVTFAVPGTYVLRLTVSDGSLSSSDDVTVNPL